MIPWELGISVVSTSEIPPSLTLQVSLPVYKIFFFHFLALCPWSSYLTSLSFRFIIYKRKTVVCLLSTAGMRLKWVTICKVLRKVSWHMRTHLGIALVMSWANSFVIVTIIFILILIVIIRDSLLFDLVCWTLCWVAYLYYLIYYLK
jgi:hypothetical protein